MKFPTIMLQLRNNYGLPVDVPDDLQSASIDIALQLQEAWLTGVDVVYGEVDRENFLEAENQINQEQKTDSSKIQIDKELDSIEDCRNEVLHLMRVMKEITDENLELREFIQDILAVKEEE
tara:strand:+ start:1364 stop:1726 length:363 start_codon:yes stop_codon:yes gene_type:complete